VRFLIDAQLPPGLVRFCVGLGHEATHVFSLGMQRARDREIWAHAVATESHLITKDEDFVTIRALHKGATPAVVWLRIGNATRRGLIDTLSRVWPSVIAAIERGETIVQVPE
jgi:predicted nuclease of predicted toxin-antitoxin system